MAKQVLTAPYRVRFLYTVQTLQHKLACYCDVQASADPTGYDLKVRPGFTALGLSVAVDTFFGPFHDFFNPSTTSFDGALLEKRNGTSWEFVATVPTTVAVDGTPAVNLAIGACFSGKDALNRRILCYMFEGAFGLPNKLTSYAALNSSNKAIVDLFFNIGAVADGSYPYAWRTSQDGQYATRWLAQVIDTNQKLRRLRRIA
jgi:hypothetical protein